MKSLKRSRPPRQLLGSRRESLPPRNEEPQDHQRHRQSHGKPDPYGIHKWRRLRQALVHGRYHRFYDLLKPCTMSGDKHQQCGIHGGQALQANGRKQAPILQLQQSHRRHDLGSHPDAKSQVGTPSKKEEAQKVEWELRTWKESTIKKQTERSKCGSDKQEPSDDRCTERSHPLTDSRRGDLRRRKQISCRRFQGRRPLLELHFYAPLVEKIEPAAAEHSEHTIEERHRNPRHRHEMESKARIM